MSSGILKLERVAKSFGGVPALKPLSLEVRAGESVGLLGENGAGKSTLLKILSGVFPPDKGRIEWLGRAVDFRSPHDALVAGISTIHQELAYCGGLTVAENLLLGEKWTRTWWGGVDWSGLDAQAARILEEFELPVRPDQLFRELSAAQRQEVAIARAISRQARLLILDEPTASLSDTDADRLLNHLKQLRQRGVTLIYVSHRLDEVLRLTDRVVVLRDGELVANYSSAETTLDKLVRDMVGRPVDQVYPHVSGRTIGPVVLELDRATRDGLFEDISLRLQAGEIVGLAGLVGAGRSELARAVFGMYPLDRGEMRLHGRPWRPRSPHEALQGGLAYVPEERKRHGFVLDHSVRDSISIGFSDLIARGGWLSVDKERTRVEHVLRKQSIRAREDTDEIGHLSGGNQQKALLGRWLEREPQILILDEPTRGVDVAAKAEIHSMIGHLAGEGRAILLISSDLPELLGMSDRLLVLHRGRISAELNRSQMTQENVLLAASGFEHQATAGGGL